MAEKPSKQTRTERQRLIEETMRKQRAAGRRRTNLIVAVAVVVAVLIVGAAAYEPIKNKIQSSHYAGLDLASVGAPASACQKIVTRVGMGVQDHVPEGQSVDYTDAPPAFGPHWNVQGVAPAPFSDKFYSPDDRPALEALVHNLEHGYTILWYDQTAADDSTEMAQIRAIADKFDSSDTNFREKFIAAPWLSSDEDGKSFPDGQHIAMTHWKADPTDAKKSTGVWQYCSQVSGAALIDYMKQYPYTDAPEPVSM